MPQVFIKYTREVSDCLRFAGFCLHANIKPDSGETIWKLLDTRRGEQEIKSLLRASYACLLGEFINQNFWNSPLSKRWMKQVCYCVSSLTSLLRYQ